MIAYLQVPRCGERGGCARSCSIGPGIDILHSQSVERVCLRDRHRRRTRLACLAVYPQVLMVRAPCLQEDELQRRLEALSAK